MASNSQQEVEIVKKAVEALGIHFDNVQVFANRYDPTTGRTVALSIGDGNRFAIIGHVNAWLDDVMNEDDDDDCDCGQCDCGAADEDHDDLIGGPDEDDDSLGNH